MRRLQNLHELVGSFVSLFQTATSIMSNFEPVCKRGGLLIGEDIYSFVTHAQK